MSKILTIESLNNLSLLKRIHDHMDDFLSEELSHFDDVVRNFDLKVNLLWELLLEELSLITEEARNNHYELRKAGKTKKKIIFDNEIDYSGILSLFSRELIELIYFHVSKTLFISSETETKLQGISHDFHFMTSMARTPQITARISDEEVGDSAKQVYQAMIDLPLPFNDDRFSVYPIYTSGLIDSGLDRSIYLKNKKGSVMKLINSDETGVVYERQEQGYYSNFIDGKVGFIFYFKDLPSMIISFNFDNNKNIFINQIQCQRKDRGHYKLKNDWKLALLDYIKQVFPSYHLHIIDGQDLVKKVKSSYTRWPEHLKPSADTYNRIISTYDGFLSENQTRTVCGYVNYRKLENL